jgi:hypothetical protein
LLRKWLYIKQRRSFHYETTDKTFRYYRPCCNNRFFFAACEGPAGPAGKDGQPGTNGQPGTDGKDGDTIINITINGSTSAGEIKNAIAQAIAEARAANGGINDGSTEAKAFTLVVSGFELYDDMAMKTLFAGIGDFYVNLDLSGLTGSFYPYSPFSASADKAKILSLVLSDEVTGIGDAGTGTAATSVFHGFTRLKTFKADKVERVGTYAFNGCTSLTNVTLPAAETIGTYAFNGCTALANISLPAAETIGNYAFNGCTALASVTLPAAKSIGTYAFQNTALTNVSLPVAESIASYAFNGCTALASVTLTAAESIGNYAFQNTGTQAIVVTMGDAAPRLGQLMFYNVSSAKTVTVKVPSGATGYAASLPFTVSGSDATVNWGNGFRGRGWDGIGFTYSNLNQNINLTIEEI